MKYSYKVITNKQEWENFFLEQQTSKVVCPSSFIQSWSWGDFSERMGEKVFRLGFSEHNSDKEQEQSSEKLIGIGLGVFIKAKRGRYLHFRHGPIINWNDQGLAEFVIKTLKTLASQENAWFVRISPLISYETLERCPSLLSQSRPSQMHNVDSEETWILDLNKTEEELLADMRKNTRYSIRKAEKMGIEILKTKDPAYIDEFWTIMMDTVKRQKWTFYSREYIENEFKTFTQSDQALLFLAKYQGRFIAGAMFIFDKFQSVYHHSGALTEFRNTPASYLIQWEAIKEAKSRGLPRHNFWGLPLTKDNQLDMNDPWSGVGLFKTGFGGRPERWIHARDIPVNWKYRLTYFYEKFETWKRKLLNRSN